MLLIPMSSFERAHSVPMSKSIFNAVVGRIVLLVASIRVFFVGPQTPLRLGEFVVEYKWSTRCSMSMVY